MAMGQKQAQQSPRDSSDSARAWYIDTLRLTGLRSELMPPPIAGPQPGLPGRLFGC